MDNFNTHIDDLFSKKANGYKADEAFAQMDFDAIKTKLPTIQIVEAEPKPKNYFGLNSIIITVSIVSIIGLVIFLNKNKLSKSSKVNTAMQSNTAIALNKIKDSSVGRIINKEAIINVSTTKNIDTFLIKKRIVPIVPQLVKNTTADKNIITNGDIEGNKKAIKNFFSKLSNESQFFNINTTKDTIVICKNGTTLDIKANSFTTQNKLEVNGIVQLEIKEVYNFTDIIANGLHTLSNNNLLNSAGIVFINAKKNNQVLDINIKQPIQITMLSSSNNNKQLFYLDKNANDNLLYSNSNWIAKEQTENNKNSFSIRNFGWLNCGQFSKSNIEKITIKIVNKNQVDSNYTRAMLVFPEDKSVLNLNYKNGVFSQQNIPLNKITYFISFKSQNGEVSTIIQKITITKEIILTQEYKEIPIAEVRAMIDAIGSLH